MIKICLIAAIDQENGVGIDNSLPWKAPKDLLRFKSLTDGYPIIMGRKTFESLPSLLPNRQHIILTTNKDSKIEILKKYPEVIVCLSWEEIFKWINNTNLKKVFFIGGPSIWEKGLQHFDFFYLTKINKIHTVDTYFPAFNSNNFVEMYKESLDDMDFLVYTKKRPRISKSKKNESKNKEVIYIEDAMDILKSTKLEESEKYRFAKENKNYIHELNNLIELYYHGFIDLSVKIREKIFVEEKKSWFKERFKLINDTE